MFITVVIALLLFVGLVGLFIAVIGKGSDVKASGAVVAGIGIVLGAIVWFFASFTIVNATQVGVPVAFGHVGKPIDPGVHFVAPWVSVEEYPTRPITVQLVGNDAVVARTKDAGQMTVEIAARWHVEKQDASTLYYQTRTGDLGSITDNIVLPNLRQAVGQIYSVTGNLDAISNRDLVSENIRVQLNKQLVPYGIAIDTISMRSVEPDSATSSTISLFASQQQATRIAEEATKTAKIEAERRLIEAQGLKAASQATAGMTPSELQSVCIQVWQQVISKGIDKGVPVYTDPCSSSGNSLIVSAK